MKRTAWQAKSVSDFMSAENKSGMRSVAAQSFCSPTLDFLGIERRHDVAVARAARRKSVTLPRVAFISGEA